MKRVHLILTLAVIGGAIVAAQSPRERLLFDGKTTNGWRGFKKSAFPEQGWVVENGWLKHVATPKGGQGGGDIITVDAFDNFDLQFEWKVELGANSGVKYL